MDKSVYLFLKSETALQPHGAVGGVVYPVVDDSRLHFHAEVGGDVEIGQFGIHIASMTDSRYTPMKRRYLNRGICDRYPCACATALSTGFRKSCIRAAAGRDAAGLHIAVHRVFICGGVVFVHFAVPRQGIGTSGKAAVEYGQFPVFPVVDLSATGNYERQPGGFCRLGTHIF